MVNSGNRNICILGGSFDPAHRGHLNISKIALKKFKPKKIFWVITKKNPFKNKALFPLNKRIKHAKKICQNQKKIEVIYIENIVKSSKSIDVVNYFIKKKNAKNIYFMLGADNLIKFHKWKRWKKIVKLVKLIVFSRKGYDKKGMNSTVAKYLKNKIIFVKNKPISISSTELRNQIKNN